jgi:hypothetical protein
VHALCTLQPQHTKYQCLGSLILPETARARMRQSLMTAWGLDPLPPPPLPLPSSFRPSSRSLPLSRPLKWASIARFRLWLRLLRRFESSLRTGERLRLRLRPRLPAGEPLRLRPRLGERLRLRLRPAPGQSLEAAAAFALAACGGERLRRDGPTHA